MERTRRTIPLDEKIEKAQAAVFQAKDKYDAAVEELNKLQKKKLELQKQELLKAIEESTKSYEEIMAFLVGDSKPNED
jgi:hypothetical protein